MPFQQQQDPPILPRSEPPPLPKSEPPMLFKTNEQTSIVKPLSTSTLDELNINKAILDNIKVIDNWKQEQEMLMRVRNSSLLIFSFLRLFYFRINSKNMKMNRIV